MMKLGRRGVLAAGAALTLSPAIRTQGAWPDQAAKVRERNPNSARHTNEERSP